MKQAMIFLGFSLFTLAGCGATAPDTAATAATNQPVEVTKISKNTDDSAVVCRSEKKTGRHMAQRVCRTVAQIKQDSQNAEAMLRQSSPTPVTNN